MVSSDFSASCKQHLQVGLISQAALGSQRTGPGNVVRIEADGSGRSATSSSRPLASDSGGRAGMQPALVGCPLESMGEFLAVIKPPLGFFGLTGEFSTFILKSCRNRAGNVELLGVAEGQLRGEENLLEVETRSWPSARSEEHTSEIPSPCKL